jgi:hypothetical protein
MGSQVLRPEYCAVGACADLLYHAEVVHAFCANIIWADRSIIVISYGRSNIWARGIIILTESLISTGFYLHLT